MKPLKLLFVFVFLLGVGNSVHANTGDISDQNVDVLAEELVKLRAQVEDLNADLDYKKNDYKSRMAMLANQRAELEGGLKRESLTIKQQQQSIEKNRGLIKELGADSADMKPVLFRSMDAIREYVAESLPFKHNERLAELDKIREQLSSDVIDAEKAANRLWAFVEDEVRLTNVHGIYRQTIELGGLKAISEIANLGMVFMYFEMPDDRYGEVVKYSNDYRYEMITDKEQKEQVVALFDSLRKQIRQGYFELPSASLRVEP